MTENNTFKKQAAGQQSDEGWKAMKTLLDKHLPAKQKRFVIPLFWCFFLFACIVSGLTGWLAAVHLRPETKHTLVAGRVATSTPHSPDIAPSIASPLLALPFFPSPNATLAHTPQVSNAPAPLMRLNYSKTEALNFRKIQPLQLVQEPGTPRIQIHPPPQAAPLRRWAFGANIGWLTERFSMMNGASIGLMVQFQPFKRWGLRTGFQYNYQLPSNPRKPVAALSATQYAGATGNYTLLDNRGNLIHPVTGQPSNVNKVYVPIERLNRFEIPLLLYTNVGEKFKLLMGPTLSYFFSGETNRAFALNQPLFGNSTTIDKLAQKAFRPFQLGLQTGVGYGFGNKFELDIFYRFAALRANSSVRYRYNGTNLSYHPDGSATPNNAAFFSIHGTLFF